MKEIINIHLGQTGINVGDATWELFCLEHSIQSDGFLEIKEKENQVNMSQGFQTFFKETLSGRFQTRSIFLDLEDETINALKKGKMAALYDSKYMIYEKEGSSGHYSRGHYSIGRGILDRILNSLQSQTESCDHLQGFMVTANLAGGTGSGLGSLLMYHLNKHFPKKEILGFSVLPSENISNSVIEPYNAILSMEQFQESQDLQVIFDNESIYDICRRQLDSHYISLTHVNQIIAQTIASMTVNMRFEGSLNRNLHELQTNLVPFKRINYIIPSFSPFISEQKSHQKNITTQQMTLDAFNIMNSLMSYEPQKHQRLFSCSLHYKGDIVPSDVMQALNSIKKRKTINFVDWCPNNFKVGLNYKRPQSVSYGILGDISRSLCVLSNTTGVIQTFERLGAQWDTMFKRRAFCHWLYGEGMEKNEFECARYYLDCKINDYKDTSKDIDSTQEQEFDSI